MKILTQAGYWALCEVCLHPIEVETEEEKDCPSFMCEACGDSGFCRECALLENHDCEAKAVST